MRQSKSEQICSLCGRHESEVFKLILGPVNVNICDECVDKPP